jgi:hypothetical protein
MNQLSGIIQLKLMCINVHFEERAIELLEICGRETG